jgi:type II secretory pathway pseudopilin PulG
MLKAKVRREGSRSKDSGYMLLVLMIAVAMLMITMLGVARNYKRELQRDREVEMIHRGVQYERAVRRYYIKFGTYPNSIEQLENTNNVRFLRKRYKDPMSPDGEWKLAHLTDINLNTALGTTPSSTAPGSAGTGPAITGDLSTDAIAAEKWNAANPNADSNTNGTATGGTNNTGTGSTGATGSGTSSGTGGNTNPVLGGGPVVGVVSKMKTEGIHAFNNKTKYSEWFFIYDPSQDKGQMLVGPYNPNMFVGGVRSGGNSPSGNSPSGGNNGGNGSSAPGTGSTNPNVPVTQ